MEALVADVGVGLEFVEEGVVLAVGTVRSCLGFREPGVLIQQKTITNVNEVQKV